MATLDLKTVAQATGGTLVQGDPTLEVDSYAIDSRQIRGGELFFALRGPHHDGHRFLPEVLRRGAAAAVISRPGRTANLPHVKVADTSQALRDLARSVRRHWDGTLIGITGSCGKTTTKEMLRLALEDSCPLLATPGNLNNLFGLPLVLLDLEAAHQVALLEMGISTPGEMRSLAAIACPDVAVLLNVLPVHTEQLTSLQAVAQAKLEILDALQPGGTVVFNADDPLLAAGVRQHSGPTFSFGMTSAADLYVVDVPVLQSERLEARLRTRGQSVDLHLPLGGRHNLANAMAALAAAMVVGLPVETGVSRLASFTPPPMRGVRHQLPGDVVLWDDSYNSNPAAMQAMLSVVAASRARRRVVVSADMLELGPAGPAAHEALAGQVAAAGVSLFIGIGPLSARTVASLQSLHGLQAVGFPDAATAARSLPGMIQTGDLILVKGSRGMSTEIIVTAIKKALQAEGS